ncbi:multiple epidermal growth factor-like domains protein 11 isoform X2 [Pomacea canaliculata]|uniref:multiple epidermal growth factor-like domains protein 11 isoform X2 n=1 Tax=Pomacea canaliculata TaxID=400727 RepID=UPI000D7341A1|nr:multiple epidermal growth factor-like domains protein 11 isoform X2 [Pomacea canaliculata]
MAAWVTCLVTTVLGLLTTASGAGPTTAAGTIQCQPTQYLKGSTCSPCGNCAGNKTCDSKTGRCLWGCLPGFKISPDTCTVACDNGKYGQNCSQTCGQCKNRAACHTVSGSCASCEPGYQAPLCKLACVAGRYGDNCGQSCGRCAGNQSCTHTNGSCLQCQANHQPPLCKDCTAGHWGATCGQQCGQCASGRCDRNTGWCSSPLCKPGWRGPSCNETCGNHRYGQNCSITCGQCKKGAACHQVSGYCAVCEPGYQAPLCKLVCPGGRHGENCSKACGHCSEGKACDPVSGNCWQCADNFLLPLCTDCVAGQWGPTCGQRCGHCTGGQCGRYTGTCTQTECQDGWTDASCQKKCPSGTYGANCSHTCGHCYANTSCRHDNGICESDCQDGFFGILCKRRSEDLKVVVAGSVVGAATLISVTIVCICILHRKKKYDNTSKGADRLQDHRGREEETPEKSSESPDSENNQLRCSSTSRMRSDPAYDPLNVNPGAIHLYETYFRSRALHGVDPDDPAEPAAREAEGEPEDMYQNINIASMHNNFV